MKSVVFAIIMEQLPSPGILLSLLILRCRELLAQATNLNAWAPENTPLSLLCQNPNKPAVRLLEKTPLQFPKSQQEHFRVDSILLVGLSCCSLLLTREQHQPRPRTEQETRDPVLYFTPTCNDPCYCSYLLGISKIIFKYIYIYFPS